jgi:hypothetical protein
VIAVSDEPEPPAMASPGGIMGSAMSTPPDEPGPGGPPPASGAAEKLEAGDDDDDDDDDFGDDDFTPNLRPLEDLVWAKFPKYPLWPCFKLEKQDMTTSNLDGTPKAGAWRNPVGVPRNAEGGE